MKKKPEKPYSNQTDTPDLDCTVCIHKKGCVAAASGKFCERFQSRTLDLKGKSPLGLWEKTQKKRFDDNKKKEKKDEGEKK